MQKEAIKNGVKLISSRAVENFSALFLGTVKADLQKPIRIWNTQNQYLNEQSTPDPRGLCTTISLWVAVKFN